jgi:voltage-gated potassium channel Kch
METLDAEQLNSLVFGLAVMILAVATVLVGAALVVKLKTTRAVTIEPQDHLQLVRSYEALSRSTAEALEQHGGEITAVRKQLAQIEQRLGR